MRAEDFRELLCETDAELHRARSLGIVGLNAITDKLICSLKEAGHCLERVGIYDSEGWRGGSHLDVQLRSFASLRYSQPDVLVIADDARKEELLRAVIPYVVGTPKIIIAGYEHFAFRSPIFQEEWAKLEVPSLANGYPNSAIHLYQCLENAARRNLEGVVVELGMFRGGTTMFLSKISERLGSNWKILGFPPRRSPLDMYDHPDLRSNDIACALEYLRNRNVEIVPGDIVDTCRRLREEHLVLTFFDSDNYSSAKAALEIVKERTILGGTIVFDHFTGSNRFKYTLGERMAGEALLDDRRYFHLHGTGVFYRQS